MVQSTLSLSVTPGIGKETSLPNPVMNAVDTYPGGLGLVRGSLMIELGDHCL